MQKKYTEVQRWADAGLREMIEQGFFGALYVIVILPPTSLNPEPFVIDSNDSDLVYKWEVPKYMVEAVEQGKGYVLLEDGVPELGLDGTQLVLFIEQESLSPSVMYVYVSVIPFQEQLDAINAYYDNERRNVGLILGLAISLSVLAIILITFFILNYLIHKRITESIDVLAAEAEKIMEGNLDVRVKVHQGGEFEVLEHAFKEMVEGMRKYIARSIDEE